MEGLIHFTFVSCDTWYGRLGHVNLNTLKRMISLDLLPKLDISKKNKCEICIQAKQCRKPFKSVERSTKLLGLIHSDICELNGIMTHGEKRYFIIFINDFSKYYHVYLIISKDEASQRFVAFKNKVEN